jgi:hypothetical protein
MGHGQLIVFKRPVLRFLRRPNLLFFCLEVRQTFRTYRLANTVLANQRLSAFPQNQERDSFLFEPGIVVANSPIFFYFIDRRLKIFFPPKRDSI